MSGLSIGGYKRNNTNEPPLVQISNEPVQPSAEPVNEPNQEPVQEPISEPVNEPVQTTTNEPSTEPPVQEPVNEPVQPSTGINNTQTPEPFNEETVLNYLSETLGQKFNSIEDLKPKQFENPLDKDPYLKTLYDWRESTGRPIEDWVKFQKDYEKMSDVQVAREFLQYKYPTLTQEEINDELSFYVASEDDLDEDVRKKNRELKKLSIEGRQELNNLKSEFNTPLNNNNITPEVQEQLNFAASIKQQIEDGQKQQVMYNQSMQNAVNQIEKVALKLTDELSLDFKVSNESKQTLAQDIAMMPHWENQDGSLNFSNIAEDGVKIKHFNEIMALVYKQGLDAGKDSISQQANNTTLSNPQPMSTHNNPNSKGVKIEGLEQFLGNKGMKIGRK